MQRPSNEKTEESGILRSADESLPTSQNTVVERLDHGALHRQRRPKLRQLDAKDVDAVFAEDPGAIISLRDVQVHHCFTSAVRPSLCGTCPAS